MQKRDKIQDAEENFILPQVLQMQHTENREKGKMYENYQLNTRH